MTATERDRVRAIVERTCAAQGVPIEVPVEQAREVAAMIALRRPQPTRRRRQRTRDVAAHHREPSDAAAT
jgi:hypothetical protein